MYLFKIFGNLIHFLKRKYYTYKVVKQCKSYIKPLWVGGKCSVTNKTRLCKNVSFNGMEITGGGNVTIGNNFHSGTECLMITQNHKYDGGNAIPYDSDEYIYKDIIIKDNVWLGSRVIILGGVTIGEGAIIQAGSVVVKSIPDYAIAGGNPARVFKHRDIENYEMLKREGKFH